MPPQELLLYAQEQEEEGYMHESSSNNNSRGRTFSSSAWESPRAPAAASLRRNKQFQGYQTIMSGGIKRYGDAYSVQAGSGVQGSTAAAQVSGMSGGGHSGSQGRLRPDDAMVESWQASARKRKMIVLSDDSEEDGDGASDDEDQGRGKRPKSMSREEGESPLCAAHLFVTTTAELHTAVLSFFSP